MDRNKLIQRLMLLKKNPDLIQAPSNAEVAELVLAILSVVENLGKDIESGKIKGETGKDGYTPMAGKDYLSANETKEIINEVFTDVVSDIEGKVQERLNQIRDGKDGEDALITQEHINQAAEIAYDMITLPDFDELITQNPLAIRNALELLDGDERLSIDAINGVDELKSELNQNIGRRISSSGGGLNALKVQQMIDDTASAVSSVNSKTGAVVLDPDDLDDTSTTNKFTTAGDITKLAGIETGADVTDATNVDAAGATMNTDTDVSSNSWVLDEDNMASDDATKVPTQQSVKAYVDAQVGLSDGDKGDITVSSSGSVWTIDNGVVGVANFDTDTSDAFNFLIGSTLDTPDVGVSSNGTTITLSIEKSGGGDIRYFFSDGVHTHDCTPADTVTLTAGTDASPQINYVYILQSTKALTVSTSGWPSAEHAHVATVLCQSAASLQTEGAYKVHVWTDHVESTSGSNIQGHLAHLNEWMRNQQATWQSGIALTPSITTNAGSEDNIDIATTSGTVLQLHDHSFPAFDTSVSSSVFIVNQNGAAYTDITDLNAADQDDAGNAITNNKIISLVIWGAVNEDSTDCKLFLNLPSGFYSSDADAQADTLRYANYSIPSIFKGVGFLIARLSFKYTSANNGTWTLVENLDLRGSTSTVFAGGNSASSTEFVDSTFKILDETDITKVLQFQVSGVTTATTRTLTVPDASGTIVLNDNTATITNKTIDGDNNTISNLDIGNEVDWAVISDVSDRSAFASGDKLLIFEAGVGLRKIDYDDLPGASGGAQISGTPVDNQIAVWTNSTTIEGTSDFTFDGADLIFYNAANDGNPEIRLGASDAEELHVQTVFDSAAQTLDYVLFTTDAASATADKGLYRFNVDGTDILDIDDGGINFAASKGISINGTDIITDSAGTATLSNIDALDATTENTIEAAIDTLANLTSVQGQTITLSGSLTVESASTINQDLSSDASPTFAGFTITNAGAGADPTISSNSAGKDLTITAEDLVINDGTGSSSLVLNSATIIAGAASTYTLQNINALDATTESTIESAIDTLANLTSASSLATVGTLTSGNADAIVSASSTTTAGKIEVATAAETTTGTDATRAVSPDGLAGSDFGKRNVQALVFEPTTDVATGDGAAYFVIPENMGGMNLVAVHAEVITAGTTGTTDIQIHNVTQAADMLTTKITIDSTETGSDTAATAAVIDTANDDVADFDVIRIDVDAVSTTAPKGLIVTCVFQTP